MKVSRNTYVPKERLIWTRQKRLAKGEKAGCARAGPRNSAARASARRRIYFRDGDGEGGRAGTCAVRPNLRAGRRGITARAEQKARPICPPMLNSDVGSQGYSEPGLGLRPAASLAPRADARRTTRFSCIMKHQSLDDPWPGPADWSLLPGQNLNRGQAAGGHLPFLLINMKTPGILGASQSITADGDTPAAGGGELSALSPT